MTKELSDLIKEFVSRPQNAQIVADLTKLSSDYFRYTIEDKGEQYQHTLDKIKVYLDKHSEFGRIDPKKFSVELLKYWYDNRSR